MDISEAKKIVEMLANGINPITGEKIPSDSHYNDPIIIRALFTVLKSIKEPKNAGLAWTEGLKNELSLLFEDGKTIKELSEYFERTKGAIKSELTHQGLIK